MNSRTAGAPSMPVATEEEMTMAELDAALQDGAITPEQYQAMVVGMQSRVAEEGMRLGETGPAAEAAAMLPRTGAHPRPAGPAPVTADPNERQYGRLSLPRPGIMTESEIRESRLAADTAKRVAEAEERMDARRYGSRHGGGAPFRSEGEAEEYYRRNILSEAQKRELQAQGKSGREIALMQMSAHDKDAIESGYSGGSGWVPVYTPDGGVTYLERAVSPGFGLSETQKAFGTNRLGDRVARGEVSDSLERPDLEAKGYTKENMQGPYGQETVWKRTALGEELAAKMRRERGADAALPTLEEYVAEQQNNRMMRRLRNDALRLGLAREQVDDKAASDLRTLIADTRAAAKGRQAEVNRRARMAAPYRRELAFSEMGQGNDWQDAVAAENLAPGLEGMTPLGVEAANLQNALRLAQAMELGGGDPMNAARMQAQLAGLTGEPAVRMSQLRGEAMGTGLGAGHVQERYRHWFLDPGPSSAAARERGFRGEMERLNYTPAQIDAYLDQRRAAGDVPAPLPREAVDPSLLPPM